MTVTFCTSQPSRSITTLTMQFTGLVATIYVAGHFGGYVDVFFETSPETIGMDNEQTVAAKLGRVLSLEPVTNVVGFGRVVRSSRT